MTKRYYYEALVTKVVDGDTMDMDVDMGFGIKARQRFRVKDFDAPESWRPKTEAEAVHGAKAKARAIELLNLKYVAIETFRADLHGRYVVNITMADGRSFADVMTEEGLVKLPDYYGK